MTPTTTAGPPQGFRVLDLAVVVVRPLATPQIESLIAGGAARAWPA